MNVNHALTVYEAVKSRLLAEFPELAEDGETLLDTLEGITDLNEALVELYESAAEDEGRADALKARIEQMQERKARFEARAKAKRELIAHAMEAAELKKVEAASVTLSLRSVPASVVVTDEAAIPQDYWREKVTRSVDKTLIKTALADGYAVPGAVLSNGGTTISARIR